MNSPSPSSSAAPPSAIDWQRFGQVIAKARRILLTSHIRPDCDALGSELGMAGVLRALGKDVIIVNGQATPPNLQFIDPQRQLKALNVDIAAADLQVAIILILDTSAWAQLGPMADFIRQSPALRLVVDHHVGEDDLGATLFKDTQAEATGRLVTDAAAALGVKITPEMAMPLFAAVATDTGWFRFNSTSPVTMRCAATLMEAGARPSEIYGQLYEQDTLGRLKLRGIILSRRERAGRPPDSHGRVARRFCGHRRTPLRYRRRDQPYAGRQRHPGGRNPGRASRRRLQDQLPQPQSPGRLQQTGQPIWRRRAQGGGGRLHQRALCPGAGQSARRRPRGAQSGRCGMSRPALRSTCQRADSSVGAGASSVADGFSPAGSLPCVSSIPSAARLASNSSAA